MRILRYTLLPFLIVLLCLQALGADGDINGTLEDYPIDEWKAFAEKGNAKAQFGLAIKYYTGEGVKQNPKEAEKWMIKSAKQNDVYAQVVLSTWYVENEGLPVNRMKAYAWLYLASSNKDAGAKELARAKELILTYDERMPPEWIKEAKALSTNLIPNEKDTTLNLRSTIGLYSVCAFILLLFWQIPSDVYGGDNKFISYALPSIGVLSSAFLIFSGIFLLTGWSGIFDWSSHETAPPVRGRGGGLWILIIEFWPYVILIFGAMSLYNYYWDLQDVLSKFRSKNSYY
tara:strand:+ start:194 stop:1054 length:861 start_codon:yes stop_codon:yes gene_type:complete